MRVSGYFFNALKMSIIILIVCMGLLIAPNSLYPNETTNLRYCEFFATSHNDTSSIDTHNANNGYVGFTTNLNNCIAYIGKTDDEYYTYYIEPNEYEYLSVPYGNSSYDIAIYQRIRENDNKYRLILKENKNIEDADILDALTPNSYSDFNNNPQALALSKELASIPDICTWVSQNIAYDTEKANYLTNNSNRYTAQDADKTIQTHLGICIDKAALAATMLKAQNVPTYIVCGYLKDLEDAHAWIKVYTNGEWHHIDVTPENMPYEIDETEIVEINKII